MREKKKDNYTVLVIGNIKLCADLLVFTRKAVPVLEFQCLLIFYEVSDIWKDVGFTHITNYNICPLLFLQAPPYVPVRMAPWKKALVQAC